MRRRAVIGGIGATLAAAPFGAPAQQQRPPARLGYIWIGKRGSEQSTLQGLRHGLREFGYVEGRDYVLEERYADSQPERLPSIVAELVGLPVSMILSPGVPVTQAVTKGTATIPVLATVPDLVASGFVESLARPGGNVTGISLQAGVALSEKWLELLKETFPHVRKVAVLAISPSSPYIDRIAEVGPVLAVEPVVYSAKDSDELERALLAIATNLPDGLVVAPDATLISNRARIIAFASEHRLPAVYGNLDFVPDGGLMAYFTDITAAWRRLATYVDKLLKGARPSELPVEQATTFQLHINLKTAKALGLTIPPTLLARADEVIE